MDHHFKVPRASQRGKGAEKAPKRVPQGKAEVEPKCRKVTSKRVLKYGLCPKGSPSGSDGVWRVPLEAIWGSFLMILGCIFIAWSCSFFVANDGDASA